MLVVGVDAAGPEQGWIAITLLDGRLHEAAHHADLASVVAANRDATIFGVDIPLGHDDPEGRRSEGRRACDIAAKEFLGSARAKSVFHVPPPAVWACATHDAAVELSRARGWIAVSAQGWGLRDRILAANGAEHDARFREVHPEVSFHALAASLGRDAPLQHPKTTWNGLYERLELLHAARLRPERSVGGVGRASPDDVLDATIAAWTAQRIAADEAKSLPRAPPRDPRTGRPVGIWY